MHADMDVHCMNWRKNCPSTRESENLRWVDLAEGGAAAGVAHRLLRRGGAGGVVRVGGGRQQPDLARGQRLCRGRGMARGTQGQGQHQGWLRAAAGLCAVLERAGGGRACCAHKSPRPHQHTHRHLGQVQRGLLAVNHHIGVVDPHPLLRGQEQRGVGLKTALL